MILIRPREIVAIARRLGLPLRVFVYMLFLNILSICFELIGVALLLPIFEMIQSGVANIDKLQGRHWTLMRDVAGSIGVSINLGLLLSLSFAFVLLRQAFRYYATRYSDIVQREMANSIRQKAFNRFLRADTAIQDQSSVGAVVSLLQTELRRGLDVLMAFTQSISLAVQVLSYFVALFLLSPVMSLVCIGVMSLALVLVQRPLLEIKQRGAAMTSANKRLSAFMIERLKHARLIRLSGTEKAETKGFDQLSRELSEESLQQRLVSLRMQLLLEPIAVGVAYSMFFVGGQVLGVSLERLGLFAVILIRLVPLLRSILSQYSHIVGQMPSLEWLDRYLVEISQAREPKGGALTFERLERAIGYRNVSFSYDAAEVPALRDVTTEIPAHRMTALVGPSGAGKSTFIDLLPRVRNPSSGEIQFDGTPITEFSVASLRGGIAFVPQQPQIFDISAAEHIRYGKEDATDSEVREAARLAGALSFIEQLPQGFDTTLGDGGKRLSGGQRQRLDIARALVRRSPILILDEPTSAVDADAETAFRDALRSLRTETNLTIIVIAHRLSTIADADQILVLERGMVTERGTHSELLATGGWYADGYSLQHGQGERPTRSLNMMSLG